MRGSNPIVGSHIAVGSTKHQSRHEQEFARHRSSRNDRRGWETTTDMRVHLYARLQPRHDGRGDTGGWPFGSSTTRKTRCASARASVLIEHDPRPGYEPAHLSSLACSRASLRKQLSWYSTPLWTVRGAYGAIRREHFGHQFGFSQSIATPFAYFRRLRHDMFNPGGSVYVVGRRKVKVLCGHFRNQQIILSVHQRVC